MIDRLTAPVRRLGEALRIDGRILVGFLVLAILTFVFVRFASEVVEGDTMAFDRHLMLSLRTPGDLAMPVGPHWLRGAMVDLTSLGGVSVLTLLTVIVAGYLVAARKAATALFVIVATIGGAMLSTALKSLFQRPRPDVVAHLVDVTSTSFPSGHAMNSAVVYLTLGALLARTQQDRTTRIYILAVAIALTLTIGCSRVYLGVHWPTDVLAGWIVGALWAALCSMLARALQLHGDLERATAMPVAEARPEPPRLH